MNVAHDMARSVQDEQAKLSKQLAAVSSAQGMLQEQMAVAASSGASVCVLQQVYSTIFLNAVSSAMQRAAVDDSRAAVYGQRLDAMERSAAAAVVSASALQDAATARFAACERSIDVLRQEQQQVSSAPAPPP
jgi:hypothetical protein